MQISKKLLLISCTTLLLTACGGGSDSSTPNPVNNPPPPVSNSAPSVSFTSSCTGLSCSFDASSSSDSDGSISKYFWDFGNGITSDTTENTINHEYDDDGAYQVSLTLTDNDNATANQTLSVDLDFAVDEKLASRFLEQASYGPTLEEIENIANSGYETWVDQQLSLPASKHLDFLNALPEIKNKDNVNAWFHRAVNADDQLRQRVAYALSQIWVVSDKGIGGSGVEKTVHLSNYYDLLLEHSFGNYRDLMEAVTLNPVMGEYLSMKGNQKPDTEKNIRPDENYAREMMQLFTIGLVELNNDGSVKTDNDGRPLPTYEQEDIEAFAHIFTGWTFASAESFKRHGSAERDFLTPMKAFQEFHDEGAKTLLNDFEVPAGQTAAADLKMALDNVFNHANVGPFIGKQLIQKLITSNPSPEYVERVANAFNDNGAGVRGDMKTVVKAILMDKEARLGVTDGDLIFGKVKEPILRMTALWRAFDAKAANGQYLFNASTHLGQGPLQSPSVFNFFSPFHSPSGDFQANNWVAPESELHSEATIVAMTERFSLHARWLATGGKSTPTEKDIIIDIQEEIDMANDTEAFLDRMSLLFFAGEMSAHTREQTKLLMEQFRDDQQSHKAREALAALITSPEFTVQQ